MRLRVGVRPVKLARTCRQEIGRHRQGEDLLRSINGSRGRLGRPVDGARRRTSSGPHRLVGPSGYDAVSP